MAKKSAKALNGSNLLKEAKKLYRQEECALLINDTEYKFKYDTHFANTKIVDLIRDLAQIYHSLNLDPDKEHDSEFGFVTMVYLLIIKHFTTLDIPTDSLDKMTAYLKALIDLDILDTIIDALPKEQIEKVFIKVGEVGQKVGERAELLKEKTENEIVNPELKRALFNGVVKDIQESVEKGENE